MKAALFLSMSHMEHKLRQEQERGGVWWEGVGVEGREMKTRICFLSNAHIC